jgi:hypothetical protein
MKNIWSIICEKSSVDSQTNLLSLFSCIEEVKLEIDKTKMPKGDKIVIPASFQLVSFWAIEDSTKENSTEIKVEFVDPKGKVLNEFKSILKAKKGIKRMRNITNIQGVPITESGRYYYKVSQKKGNKFKVVSELPFDIDVSYKILNSKAVKK